MHYILDLTVILIIALFIFISARRGFVRTVIEFIGYILVIALSFTISTPLGNLTYDKIIEPPILKAVEDSNTQNANDLVDKTWNALPGYIVNNAEIFGISKETLNNAVNNENTKEYAGAAVKTASQNVIKPVAAKFIGVCYALIMLTVLLFVVRLSAKWINRLFSFSLIGKINRILGGAVGLLKGIIFAALFVSVISLISALTENGFWIFTHENISNSYIFKILTEFSPFSFFKF